MLKEFREFITRGNVLDLAIGVVVGAAFGEIVTSLVDDILMPPIGLVLGGVDFKDLFITLSGGRFNTLAEAKTAGSATINYGLFLNSLVQFLIIGFALFMIVRQVNRLRRPAAAPAAPRTKDCPYCISPIALAATRCPHCTSEFHGKTA